MAIRNPFRNPKVKETDDLGFGIRITGERDRLIAKDGNFNVERVGLTTWSPYQDLVEMTWGQFFTVVVTFLWWSIFYLHCCSTGLGWTASVV